MSPNTTPSVATATTGDTFVALRAMCPGRRDAESDSDPVEALMAALYRSNHRNLARRACINDAGPCFKPLGGVGRRLTARYVSDVMTPYRFA